MKTFDNKQQTDLVILDFSKAFDTVPHRKLLHKLRHYGIDGELLSWLSAFLMERSQRVIVEGEASSSIKVDSGVPQGTVLGPLLFLIHINDLPNAVQSQVRLFADDCLLYRQIKSNEDQKKLQNDLIALEKWATTWGMKFNAKKCYIMRIHRGTKPITSMYTLDNHVLEQVQDNPYLGLLISENLKWSSHINKISKRANSTLGFLRRNLKHCPKSLKETAYFSLIRSVLDYSATVWDPYLQKDVDQLESIQRRAARFVFNDHSRKSSVTEMMQKLDWKPLADRRREQRLIMMYRIINGLIAIPAETHITPNRGTTRSKNSQKLRIFSCNTDTFKYSFFPRTVVDWNNLSENCVSAKSIEIFKGEIRGHSTPPRD